MVQLYWYERTYELLKRHGIKTASGHLVISNYHARNLLGVKLRIPKGDQYRLLQELAHQGFLKKVNQRLWEIQSINLE